VRAVAGAGEAALLDEVRTLVSDDSLVRAVFSSRPQREPPAAHRAELRPVELKGGALRLSCESFVGTQSFTRNAPFGGPEAAALLEPLLEPRAFDSMRVETRHVTLTLQRNRRGELGASRGRAVLIPQPGWALAHNREKPPPFLETSTPLLAALGLRTADGAVRAGKAKKLAEIECFLAALDGALSEALQTGRLAPPSSERPLRLVDLGCGNAYLTFAAAELLRRRGLASEVLGVDSKQQAAERNTALAAQLGLKGMRFVQGSIASARLPFITPRDGDAAAPCGAAADIVLALHACDTATDEALARAVVWRAPLVLAAPCCQHNLQVQLRAGPPMGAALAPLARHGLLRERLGDVLTDAARAHVLSLLGYRCGVAEFIAAEHSNRNLMLRCERTRARPPPAAWAELDALCAAWGVRPPLLDMLAPQLRDARARGEGGATGGCMTMDANCECP
jgi:SAM-dependent methyltransferase